MTDQPVKAQDIKAGMTYTNREGGKIRGGWKATGDAVVAFSDEDGKDMVFLPVKHYDGGEGARVFELDAEVPIDHK
jgi:hypothetical protein